MQKSVSEMEISQEEIIQIAYRLIRQETNRFDREGSDAELGSYVRGVVQLQTEIYEKTQNAK